MTAISPPDDVYYPESDDEPIGETGIHVPEVIYLYQVFKHWYRDEPQVLVGGNQFHYYQQGDPSSVYCPDIYVVKDVPKCPPRRTYKYWEEGQVPSLIIEVTSDSTRNFDLDAKKALYERLGIEELILYDPLDESQEPPLQGFVLTDGRYCRVPLDSNGVLTSQTTGLQLYIHSEIRVLDPATSKLQPRYEEACQTFRIAEAVAARRAAEARLATAETLLAVAEERAAAAEEELARLRRELERRQSEG